MKTIWAEQEGREPPYVDVVNLAELKKTNRERDYAVIGELARRMKNPAQRLQYSRSARELMEMAERYPDLVNMPDEELFAYWDLWLHQAQATNELDRYTYSHGVFLVEPGHEEVLKKSCPNV